MLDWNEKRRKTLENVKHRSHTDSSEVNEDCPGCAVAAALEEIERRGDKTKAVEQSIDIYKKAAKDVVTAMMKRKREVVGCISIFDAARVIEVWVQHIKELEDANWQLQANAAARDRERDEEIRGVRESLSIAVDQRNGREKEINHLHNRLTNEIKRRGEDISRAAARQQILEQRIKELQAQLPSGMKHCTIQFKECEKGHGYLTATNWIDHGCPACRIKELEELIRKSRDLR